MGADVELKVVLYRFSSHIQSMRVSQFFCTDSRVTNDDGHGREEKNVFFTTTEERRFSKITTERENFNYNFFYLLLPFFHSSY